jgi:hypothetical protein
MRCAFCAQPAVIGYGKEATDEYPTAVPFHYYCGECFEQRRPAADVRAALQCAEDFLAKGTAQ